MAGLHPRRDGLPARIVPGSSRKTVPSNSVVSSDGHTLDVQSGRSAEEQKQRTRYRTKATEKLGVRLLTEYKISILYTAMMGVIGAYYQGWLGWLI